MADLFDEDETDTELSDEVSERYEEDSLVSMDALTSAKPTDARRRLEKLLDEKRLKEELADDWDSL